MRVERPTEKDLGSEAPPPGGGLTTIRVAVPGEARSAAEIETSSNCRQYSGQMLVGTRRVGRGEPFQ